MQYIRLGLAGGSSLVCGCRTAYQVPRLVPTHELENKQTNKQNRYRAMISAEIIVKSRKNTFFPDQTCELLLDPYNGKVHQTGRYFGDR